MYKGRIDWPMPRFDPAGTGFNPYERIISPANVATLRVAWSDEFPDLNSLGTPVVVDGVLYVGGHVDSTNTARILAADARTGEVLWTREDSGQPISDLSVVDGRIYAGFLTGHVLRAYDAATGDLVWSFPGPQFAPPVAKGGVSDGDDIRNLWAVDAASGRRRWVAHAPPTGYGFGIAVAGGKVFVGGHQGDGTSPIYAYDATTGALVWRTPTQASAFRTPAVDVGTVFVDSDKFYALDVRTGHKRWTAPVVTNTSPAVAEGVVYAASADDGTLYAFDAGTGEQLWATPLGANAVRDDPVVANGLVFANSVNDILHAFDAVTGTELWSYPSGDVDGQVVVNGTLYVSTNGAVGQNGSVYAFRLPVS